LIWQNGRDKASNYLKNLGYCWNELNINDNSINVLKPLGHISGNLNEEEDDDERFNLEEEIFRNATHSSSDENEIQEDEVSVLISDSYNDINEKKFASTIEYQGDVMHKSNIISSVIHNRTKLTTKRTIRVFTPNNENIVINNSYEQDFDEDKLYITNIMATIVSNKSHKCLTLCFFSVDQIFLANKLQNSIDYEKIKEATFGGVMLCIESIENDNIICNSKYGDKISVEGTYSSLIKNDSRRTTLNDRIVSNIKFDIQSVMEVKEYFQQIIANSKDLSKIPSNSFKINNTQLLEILNFEIIEKTKNISSNKFECLKCGAKVLKDLMRSHVAKHI
jgi:hypothetical protein